MDKQRLAMNRRRFLAGLSAVGVGSTLMPGALVAVAQDAAEVTVEMLAAAQEMAGLEFSTDELHRLAERLNRPGNVQADFETLRAANLGNATQPALVFNPVPPGMTLPTEDRPMRRTVVDVAMPSSDEALAFLPLTHLARLVETRQVKPSELTALYLDRLKRYDPLLHCVVSYTEELASRQARQADEEIAAGTYRGPLHGIPWGAKDLLAVRGTRTTWGASPYANQVIDADATVYRRLTDAGAILVAKLSMGALASGDRWFGGRTRNPWNLEQGASGSSAGPGAATAAGLVGFAIGTETRGSIISPSTRNGVTGLRPTFGRVSRYGAMALSWTMDKIGPMCRSAEDCALVFDVMLGPDGLDNTVLDVPFNWDATSQISSLRVGYLRSAFEDDIVDDSENPQLVESQRQRLSNSQVSLGVIRDLGVQVAPFDLPDVPTDAIGFILGTEAAAAFDVPTLNAQLDSMRQPPEESRWPDSFRASRFVPAVEYLQANRLRMRIIEEVHESLGDFDLFVGSDLGLTNLTGHPEISIPSGFAQGSPTSLRLTGKLFGEAGILRLAHAYQEATEHHLQYPPL
ncbi:MAG: amidase [Acidobacteriota bacterium]|nr:amidase [Acidobacteriota bacterium]